jgi:hypothetical protein
MRPAICPEPPLVFSHELLGGLRFGFWWFPLNELHVHSSMWNEAEALSEYGVVPEFFALQIASFGAAASQAYVSMFTD